MPVSISDSTVSLALFRQSAKSASSANQTALTTTIESSMPQASGPAAATSQAQARLLELMLDITPIGQNSDNAEVENPEPPTSGRYAVTDPAQRNLLERLDIINPREEKMFKAMNNLSDEQIAAGWTKYGSPGVRGYETLEEIEDPELRAMFERVHEGIEVRKEAEKEIPGVWNWDDDLWTASKTFTRGFREHFDAEKGRARYTSNVDIPTLVGATETILGDKFAIEGELAFQKDDGTYLMGNFEIRNKETGEVQLSHQGDGEIKFFDLGEVWRTHNTRTA